MTAFVMPVDFVDSIISDLDKKYNQYESGDMGLVFKTVEVDTIAARFRVPGVYLLSASTGSQGNRALGLNMLLKLLMNETASAGYFCKVGQAENTIKTLLMSLSNIDAERFEEGVLYTTDWRGLLDSVSSLNKMPMYISEEDALGSLELLAALDAMIEKSVLEQYPLKLILVDQASDWLADPQQWDQLLPKIRAFSQQNQLVFIFLESIKEDGLMGYPDVRTVANWSNFKPYLDLVGLVHRGHLTHPTFASNQIQLFLTEPINVVEAAAFAFEGGERMSIEYGDLVSWKRVLDR